MSTTVQTIYDRVCFDMLENGGLVLGVVTPAQFLNYLEEAVLDFAAAAGLVKKIFTQQVKLTVSQYTVPNDILQVQACFVGGIYIPRTTIEELYNGEYEWAKQYGTPQAWFDDGLPAKTIQLFPIPDYSGTDIEGDAALIGTYGTFAPSQHNLTMVGTSGPSTTTYTLTLGSTLPDLVSDSLTPYLIYRVLWRIFSMDGEAQDRQRAIYCNARWLEGIALTQAIRAEAIADTK